VGCLIWQWKTTAVACWLGNSDDCSVVNTDWEGAGRDSAPPVDGPVDPRDFDYDWKLPGFHFVPWPFDWLNDPNGPFYDPVHDKYHLMYQYQTPRMWGHAVSDDLVNWQQLPMALTRQNTYDSGGDFSGSATVLDDDARTPVLTVSSSTNTVVFVAVPANRSDPYLTEWVLPAYNPIYTTPARDPTEIMKTTSGAYRIADGTSSGTELWEAANLDDVLSNAWTKVGMLQTNSISPGYWFVPFDRPLVVLQCQRPRGTWT